MYNEQLEQLIDAALADGVLTEKEKQILFKKAQSLGIDLDEFEMVLNARLFNLKLKENSNNENSAPRSSKFGDVRKCPNCGCVIGSFQMNCPDCGFEFIGVGPNKYVEKFSFELQEAIKKKNLKIQSILAGVDPTGIYEKRKIKVAEKAESDFVKSYPLPMTKEDCIEMLNYILPKTHSSNSNGATNSWRHLFNAILVKLEQEYPNDKKIQELVISYRNQTKISSFAKFVIWYKDLGLFAQIFLILVFFILLLKLIFLLLSIFA